MKAWLINNRIITRLLVFIGNDWLFRKLIMYCNWWNNGEMVYYAINKDGTKTRCAINSFPSNPELAYDNKEAYNKTVSKVKMMLTITRAIMPKEPKYANKSRSELKQINAQYKSAMNKYASDKKIDAAESCVINDIAHISGRIREISDKASAMQKKLMRTGDDRLVEIIISFDNWEFSHVPLKYLSIKP